MIDLIGWLKESTGILTGSIEMKAVDLFYIIANPFK